MAFYLIRIILFYNLGDTLVELYYKCIVGFEWSKSFHVPSKQNCKNGADLLGREICLTGRQMQVFTTISANLPVRTTAFGAVRCRLHQQTPRKTI